MPIFADDSQRICTSAKKYGMTECNVAGVARKYVPGRCRPRIDDGEDSNGGESRVGEHQRNSDCRCQERNECHWLILHHCFLPESCPNNPCGRTRRTMTSRTKNTVVDHVGDHTTAVTSSITSIANEAMSAPLR